MSSKLVTALLAVSALTAGCATSIAGSPAVDPVAASSLTSMASTAASDTATGTGSTTDTPPTTPTVDDSSSPSPMPPIPPSAASSDAGNDPAVSTSDTPTPSSTPDATTSEDTTGDTVQGIPVDTIADELQDDPVVTDQDARANADPDALADLDDQVSDARDAGLNVWVVLIGHDVDKLTDVSAAIARRSGGTVVVVATSQFAVSSKQFSDKQLNRAEDVAASADSGVQAASMLVEQFRAMATSTSTKPTGQSSTPDGPVVSLTSFQLADHSIGCLILDGTVRCDLQVQHTYHPPKNPHPTCEGDYGSSIRMPADGPATFICVSDTAYDPNAPVLADGDTTQVGDVMCFADGHTMTCLNVHSVHGFSVDPDEYSVF